MSIFIERPKDRAVFGRIFPPSEDWLRAQDHEEVIEPDLPIVDAHHHLWDMPGHRYLLDEFREDLASGHRIVATVYAEALSMYRVDGPPEMRPVGETEFASGMAAMSASGKYGPTRVGAAIVGFADLALGERVEPVLAAHIAAGGGRLRGVRYSTSWDADPTVATNHTKAVPHLLADRDVRAALACLPRLGLSFDALVLHPQLQDVVDLARAMPDLSIVLNHVGVPVGHGPYAGRRDEVFTQWRRGLVELAKQPNVCVKLGGMVLRLAAFDYVALPRPPGSAELADHWRPYVETCIELFGAQRCLFESNFPVDKLGTGYRVLWNAYKRLAAGASADEKAALFSGTAQRVYRLPSF